MIVTTINDRYRLDAKIGSGGMGAVYRAFDLLLEREVAIKILNSAGLGSAGRARLLNEAQAAARLNHPNIVAVYDAGEARNWRFPAQDADRYAASGESESLTPYIVMQYVIGTPLNGLKSHDLARVLDIAEQLCAALEHAHANGVIHRDLKPENVLVSADGQVRLMDFGLARSVASRLSRDGELVGTVFYMAPEMALGQPYDGRSDLYSLGVILYELLAGRLPFQSGETSDPNAPAAPATAGDVLAIISQHIYAPPVPPSTYNPAIPSAVESLILKLMSKDPAERPSSAREVTELLDRLKDGDLGSAMDAAPHLISPLERLARGRMIGRIHELKETQRIWRAAASGHGQVLLVSGEPGIGKTRLMRELSAMAEVSRGRVLTGVCYSEGSAPYAPVAQMARAAMSASDLQDIPPAALSDLFNLVPGLRPSGSSPAGSEETLDPQAGQTRRFESLLDLLRRLCRRSPVLIVLEDAHWADSGTLSLVRQLARQVHELPVLLALTYREVELGESRALADLIVDINRERLGERIKLARLSRPETGELVGAMFGEDIRPEFLNLIYQETEGNPFFIEEVCKALIEEGQITYQSGRWQAAALSEITVPQSVRLAIQARVGRLAQSAQDTLRIASIFGREFAYEPLLAVSGLDEEDLIDCLDASVRAQLLVELQPEPGSRRSARPAFAFTHALIPAALLDNLTLMRRQRLHRLAGLSLEKLYPDRLEALAPQLSRHFLEAGEHVKAVKYLVRVGDQARQVFAYSEAIEAYQQVVEFLLDQGNYEKAARVLMKLGLVYHQSYDFARAQDAYDQGFRLWQRAAVEPASPVAPAPHPLRTVWTDPITLDPSRASDSGSTEIIVQLFDGLVELTPDLTVRPCIARQWEIQDGGRRYVFHLRRDYRWSDGFPVTAGDFTYSWLRSLDPAVRSANASLLYSLRGAQAYAAGEQSDPTQVGIQTPDDWTLVVELEEPAGYFLHLMAAGPALPVPRHVVEKYGDGWARPETLVTNGAFRLDEWQLRSSLSMRRNPDYPGRFPGNLQQVVLRTDYSQGEKLQAYERGELDVINIPPSISAQVHVQYAGESLIYPTLNTHYLGFNTLQTPLFDRRIRRALVMGLNREELAGVIFNGRYSLATGGFVPPGLPGHTPGIALEYDPKEARRLLAEAGYPNGEGLPELEFRGHLDPDAQDAVEYVAKCWREDLGVRTRLEKLSKVENISQSTGIWSLGWIADYPDADNFLRVAVEGIAGIMMQDPEYLRLITTARRSVDQSERVRLYQAADRILIEEAYIVPITYGRSHLLIQPWIRNCQPLPIRIMNLKDVLIEEHGIPGDNLSA